MKTVQVEVEVGKGFPANIFLEINGFGVSYQENIEYWNPEIDDFDFWKPSRDDVKPLLSQVKEVMKELHIQQPQYFILKFTDKRVYAWNCVDKRKQIFCVSLPIELTDSKPHIRRKQDLYHELMHIKDVLCGRFPSIGKGNCFHTLINFLWGFSIEGRLERMGKPHMERQKTVNQWFTLSELLRRKQSISKELISKEQSEKLCEELWGKEVTYEEITPIAEKLMQAYR